MQVKFTKAQTNGNDFIIFEGCFSELKFDLKLMADRFYGVGCDQIIFLKKNSDSVYDIEFFNQDGSRAEMCGNGACAASVYVRDILHDKSEEFFLKISGISYRASVNNDEATVFFKMPESMSKAQGGMSFVSTGNQHLIYSVQEFCSSDNETAIDLQRMYPECNIHFLQKKDKKSIRIKTFERGVGWTKACGSGAIASVFSLFDNSTEIRVIQDGGESLVRKFQDEMALITKPRLVFSGMLY